MTEHYQPLIVIGAARSGTKIFRDACAQLPDVAKTPYDMNYIWRIGNEHLLHDELSPDLLTPAIRRKILRHFAKYRTGSPVFIEKTVSNCLRVPFVAAVFPEAKFIHLVRDGRDVIESVYRQWLAPPNWSYIIRKACSFPLHLAFSYALNYARQAGTKVLTRDVQRAGTWGPRYNGIDQDLATRDLLEVCALQWVKSVETAYHDLDQLPDSQVMTVRYEEFVCHPCQSLEQVAEFAGLNPQRYSEHRLETISSKNIGKGIENLSAGQMAILAPVIQRTLTLLQYHSSVPT